MEKYKRKIIRTAVYLLFVILCMLLGCLPGVEAETVFVIWYLGTAGYGLLLGIRGIEWLGNREKKARKKRRKEIE